MGVLANIASFFMSDRAFFWLAKPNEPENDGIFFIIRINKFINIQF